MAEVDRFTLAEYASSAGLTGVKLNMVHSIIDCMPIFDSAPLLQCNSGTINKTQVTTVYPKGQLRGYNMGVKAEKSMSRIVQDTTCLMETYHEIDQEILRLNKNSAEWRAKQDENFIRGLAASAAEKIFNASFKRNPLEYEGLGARYNKIGDCVIDGGGTGNNLTDIWLVNWAPQNVHLIYPEGGAAHPEMKYESDVDATDADGGKFKADRTWFKWHLGLAVPNPMQVIRVANIDLDKAREGASGFDILRYLTMAVERLPENATADCAFYMNRSLREYFRLQLQDKANMNFTWRDYAGKKIEEFDGVPVHRVPETVIKNYTAANKIK